MQINHSQRGFTIVETLVAITVLMIAIAGPLVVASDGLNGAVASKNQMIASYLAQESMETIKNIRDNNEYVIANGDPNGISWDATPSGSAMTEFSGCNSSQGFCDASAIDQTQIVRCLSNGPCPIYLEANGYGHNASGAAATPFTRYFYDTYLNSFNEEVVTVVVDWNEGPVPYEVSLSSELTDSTR